MNFLFIIKQSVKMDSKYKIRLGDTDSINSINTNNIIGVDLQQTSKLLPYPSVIGEVDAYQVFEEERNSCEKYRLIITINPYCTNVLFNTLTEIIRNEGSNINDVNNSNCLEVITDEENSKAQHTDGCLGVTEPNRRQMLMNTEYSRDKIGYVYHPGYDIFTNHILRNLSFKMVNLLGNNTISSMVNNGIQDTLCDDTLTQTDNRLVKLAFNTIGDFMRYSDGTVVKYRKRVNISTNPQNDLNKHLYLYDDISSFEDSINNNLSEENGWFGFVNNSTTSAKEKTDKPKPLTDGKVLIWDDLDISRVLNNYENCEFVDMYPDRSLFSFEPKINTFRKRLEYNWKVILTYPYKNDYCHNIVTSEDGKTNGLKLMSVVKSLNGSGSNAIIFRSYAKHGLQRGDFINLYINGTPLSRTIKVTNVGNMSSNNDDNALFYFYTTDTIILTEVLGLTIDTDSGKWSDAGGVITTADINNRIKEKGEYRFRRVVNGVESDYYLRVFKKLPNLKNKRQNLTDEIVKAQPDNNSETTPFEDYIYGLNDFNESPNASINGQMIDFNNEQYRLGFARTIYNDNSAQITFTDTIDIEHLVDNIGRPLHEFYVTIIKNNKGYDKWYGITKDDNRNEKPLNQYVIGDIDRINEEVEFSHCFGNLTSGFEFSSIESDKGNIDIEKEKGKIGDISVLNELGIFSPIPYETKITDKGAVNPNSGEYNADEFYGDLVEYNPNECLEHILLPICHRFNTAQRELPKDNNMYNTFQYQEIYRDDYDLGDGMEVRNYVVDEEDKVTYDETKEDLFTWQRPEGYFYQAHYPVTLKEFGSITQNAHGDIKVKEAKPSQKNGIFIEVTTTLNYGVVAGDIIYVCLDDEENYKNDKWFEFTVGYTEGKNKFYMQPYNMSWADMKEKINTDTESEYNYNWVTLSIALTTTEANKQVKLRKKNIDIPDYASRVDHNKFLWRGLYRPGELMDSDLTQYPFANNAFYINKEINFFLKRQDPYGYSGLYCSQAFPNDVKGNHRQEDNYVYKTEEDIVC